MQVQTVKEKIRIHDPGVDPLEELEIQACFVVPSGCRFIQALGWRSQLLCSSGMRLEEVDLSVESRKLMEEVLLSARQEQIAKRSRQVHQITRFFKGAEVPSP
jgi:hypothetical protein